MLRFGKAGLQPKSYSTLREVTHIVFKHLQALLVGKDWSVTWREEGKGHLHWGNPNTGTVDKRGFPRSTRRGGREVGALDAWEGGRRKRTGTGV